MLEQDMMPARCLFFQGYTILFQHDNAKPPAANYKSMPAEKDWIIIMNCSIITLQWKTTWYILKILSFAVVYKEYCFDDMTTTQSYHNVIILDMSLCHVMQSSYSRKSSSVYISYELLEFQ